MALTEQEIEDKVSQCSGTHVKRNNLRRKLVVKSNDEVESKIKTIQKEIRKLKVDGFKEQDLRGLYANITKLELMIL